METTGFSLSAVSATSPNESRGSATDVESAMDTSGHGLSQQQSVSSDTASTPAQSAQSAQPQNPAMVDIYRKTQAMLRDFLKEKNEPRSECQPFLDFVVAEAEKLPDDKYNLFQAEVFNLLQRAKRSDAPSQSSQPPTTQHQPLTQPVRSATVTSDSQREGVLPPVPVCRSQNQGSSQSTTTTSTSLYYAPSPQSFPNPGSVATLISHLGNDPLNMSGFDFSVQTPQMAAQSQPQQVTLQVQPSTSQQPQFTLAQQPQALQPQQYMPSFFRTSNRMSYRFWQNFFFLFFLLLLLLLFSLFYFLNYVNMVKISC